MHMFQLCHIISNSNSRLTIIRPHKMTHIWYLRLEYIPQTQFPCLTIIISADYTVNFSLTHWGRVTHICVGKLVIIVSDNGLSPVRRQAIIWTNAGILLIGPLGTNFSEILIEIHTFSFKKMHLKMSSGKWRPFCLVLNVLKTSSIFNLQWTVPFQWHHMCHITSNPSH